MARLKVEGDREIYYENHSGEGPPVLLIHGWGMSARCWDLNLPVLLDAGHRVVAYDHRGCGHSDKDFDDVSIAAIAEDAVALVSELGLERPVVAGWSMGGAVAVEVAQRLGENIRGMVLLGPASPRYVQGDGWDVGATPEELEVTVGALAANRPGFLHDLATGVFKGDPGKPMIDWTWSIFMEAAPNADAALGDLATVDHRELLPTLEMPVLVCSGPEDQVVAHDTAVQAAELLPNARLVEFTDSGHAPFLQETEKFHQELLDFLSELD